MLRDLLGERVVHHAAQLDGFRMVQRARAVRAVRHHLHVDADAVHVRQPLPAEPLRRIPVGGEALEEGAKARVRLGGRRTRQLQYSGDGIRMLEMLFDGDDAHAFIRTPHP